MNITEQIQLIWEAKPQGKSDTEADVRQRSGHDFGEEKENMGGSKEIRSR